MCIKTLPTDKSLVRYKVGCYTCLLMSCTNSVSMIVSTNLLFQEQHLSLKRDQDVSSGCVDSGAGVHCQLFCFYTPIGAHTSAFDGEITAIYQALSQLQPRLDLFSKVALLSDSRATLQAI